MLTADGIEEALRLWIIYEQAVFMKNGNFEKSKHSLDLYSDDESLLRVKSHITEAIESDYIRSTRLWLVKSFIICFKFMLYEIFFIIYFIFMLYVLFIYLPYIYMYII